MNLIYEKMQKDGKIGPFMKGPNGQLLPRPFAEYPKVVRVMRGGKQIKKICASQREELAFKSEGEDDPVVSSDPVVQERNELAKKVAELTEQIAKINAEKDAGKTAAPVAKSPIPEALLVADTKKPIPAAETPTK